MKILKMVLRLLALLSMTVLIVTKEVLAAVCLLIFSAVSIGIMLGEKSK